MTNREAIERLILIFERCCNRCDAEAIDLAIKALEREVDLEQAVVNIKMSDEEIKQFKQMLHEHTFIEGASVEGLQSRWIPVSERLPDNETEVLIQFNYGNSMMVGYYMFDSTVYPSGFEDENETGWYDSKDDFIGGTDEVIAWRPLPESYKEEEEC